MNNEQTLFMADCPVCNQSSELECTFELNNRIGIWLSCGCRAALCLHCKKLAMDCSGSASEVIPFCFICSAADLDYEENFESQRKWQSNNGYYPKKTKSHDKSYSLKDIQAEYPRAYKKWTQTEALCMKYFEEQGKSREEMLQIFQRQPSAMNYRGRISNESSSLPYAVNIIGKQIKCNNCGRVTLFTYSHFAKCCEQFGISENDFIEITMGYLLTKLSCRECKRNNATIIQAE
jgi:hypothetical protein